MTEADRRDTTRVELLGDLRGEVMVYQPMTVTEISDRGAQIETSFPLQLGSLHDLRLALGSSSVVVKGRVAVLEIPPVGTVGAGGGGSLPKRIFKQHTQVKKRNSDPSMLEFLPENDQKS